MQRFLGAVHKGVRIILLHVGSVQTGFLKECKMVFCSKKSFVTDDFHSEINSQLFLQMVCDIMVKKIKTMFVARGNHFFSWSSG